MYFQKENIQFVLKMQSLRCKKVDNSLKSLKRVLFTLQKEEICNSSSLVGQLYALECLLSLASCILEVSNNHVVRFIIFGDFSYLNGIIRDLHVYLFSEKSTFTFFHGYWNLHVYWSLKKVPIYIIIRALRLLETSA